MDVIIENGQVFDGLSGPPRVCHVGVQGSTVAALSEAPLPRTPATRVIDPLTVTRMTLLRRSACTKFSLRAVSARCD